MRKEQILAVAISLCGSRKIRCFVLDRKINLHAFQPAGGGIAQFNRGADLLISAVMASPKAPRQLRAALPITLCAPQGL